MEAAPEVIAIKKDLFKRAAATLRADAVIATNTSSLSVSELAQFVTGPQRFVGIHFFNPVPMMALVEVVKGTATSDATLATARAYAEAVGKTPITVKDSPGFVVNRILFPMINEAAQAFAEGVASADDIDTGMKLGTNAGARRSGGPRHDQGRSGDVRARDGRRQVSSRRRARRACRRRQARAQERRRFLRLRHVTP